MAIQAMGQTEFTQALHEGGVFLAHFWADWDDHSQSLLPVMEELGAKYSGQAVIGSINVDEAGFLPLELEIYSCPTVILYADGMEADRVAGAKPTVLYEQLLEAHLHPESIDPFELIQSSGYYF